MLNDFDLLIGTIGAALILVGYLLRKSPTWGLATWPYQITNLLGALFLLHYAIMGEVWPFVVLNLVWAADAFRSMFRH